MISDRTRTAGAACLVLSPVVYALTRFTWPHGSDGSNSQVVAVAAAHPAAWNLSGVLEAVSALFGLAGAVVLALVISGRGRVLARLGLALAAASAVGMVANWTINAQLAAQASSLPHDRTLAAYDAAVHSGYLAPFIVVLLLGVLAGPFAIIAAVRAGLVPWWTIALVVVGTLSTMAVESATPLAALTGLPGLIGFAVLARALREPAASRDALVPQPA